MSVILHQYSNNLTAENVVDSKCMSDHLLSTLTIPTGQFQYPNCIVK